MNRDGPNVDAEKSGNLLRRIPFMEPFNGQSATKFSTITSSGFVLMEISSH